MRPSRIHEMPLVPFPTERLAAVMDPGRYQDLLRVAEEARERLAGRVVWNINSTANGGGVAEMLSSLLSYTRGAGVDARWVVIGGDADFFALTKRLHNRLHGQPGDGGSLGKAEHRIYTRTLEANAEQLVGRVGAADAVLLHDPQTLGLVAPLKAVGATVIWRCHVGLDDPNELAREAWDFLRPFVEQADAYVFSRSTFVWTGIDRERVTIIRPGIDPLSAKNRDLERGAEHAILHAAGLVKGGSRPAVAPTFVHTDGSPGRVERRSEVADDCRPHPADRLVVQVSRWDALKDPLGVLRAFAENIAPRSDAHLLLAGPAVHAVSDDPEGPAVLAQCQMERRGLPAKLRARVHLASLPMDDRQENAAIVNTLQRHATVVTQKSIAEGFGLTVSEAMWKARPVVASAIGGIRDQIVDGESGRLVDPLDYRGFADVVVEMLEHSREAAALGARARERVRDEFLSPRQLTDHVRLLSLLADRRAHSAAAAVA